jgi:hypothetical protein
MSEERRATLILAGTLGPGYAAGKKSTRSRLFGPERWNLLREEGLVVA